MKIAAVRVRNVGRFVAPVAVERLSGGLDVLTEDNEFGKSTLFRAIEAVFLLKHSVSGTALERLRPYGGGEPLIEADFDVDGGAFRIRKQFGRGKGAELFDRATAASLARGVEAEDHLARLIGAGDGKPNRLGLLWVGQRRSLEPADPDHGGKDRGERSALQSAIEREIETVTSGAEAGLVRARVKDLLLPLTGGRQKQPKTGSGFDLALRERDRIVVELDAARAAAAAAAERLTRLEQLIGTRDRDYSAAALAQAAETVEAARAADERARAARQRLDRVTAEFEKAAAADAQHARALADFDAAIEHLARIEAEAALAAEERRLAGERRAALEQRFLDIEAEASALAHEETRLRAELAAHDVAERRRALADRLQQTSRILGVAQTLEAEIEALDARRAANPVSSDRWRMIEVASSEVTRLADSLAAQRQAAAPRITLVLETGGEGRVRAAGRVLGSGEDLLAEGPLDLVIAGIGVISIVPAVSANAAEFADRLAAAEARLREALDGAASATRHDALRRHEQRIADEQALVVARQTLAGVAADGSKAIAARVFSLTREHGSLPAGQLLADRAAAEAALREVSDRRAGAETAREAARRDLAAVRERLAGLDSEAAGRERRRAEIVERLPPERARDGERARLQQAADTHATAARAASRTVEAVREAAPDEARLAELASTAARLLEELEARKRNAQRLDIEISKLEGLLEQAGEDGVATRVKALEGAQEFAEEAVRRFEAEKRGLLELDEALTVAETELRARFLLPVTQRLAPYLTTVFPDAELRFGDGYKVTQLVRAGRGEEIETLSDGTREQLAVLVRLGFGRLLADSGRAAPLILDDALVYSDDTRIGRMFSALRDAATRHQVLVLTCRVGLFAGLVERLGGRRVSAERWLVD